MLIPLDTLAKSAVVSAVSDITDPKHKRFETFNNTNTTSEYKQNQAIHVAHTVLKIIKEGLELSGYHYFDNKFLIDPDNSSMYSAYANARLMCPDDLDTALERAWAPRRSDWQVRAAIPGHRVQTDEDEGAADITDAPNEPLQIMEPDRAGTREGMFAKLKAFIRCVLMPGRSAR